MSEDKYILKPNSIPGEYYCGDLPGNLQYNKRIAALAALEIPAGAPTLDDEWTHIPCIREYRAALLPHTKNPDDWRLIMAMKKTSLLHGTWIKGALLHVATGAVALMTTCNSAEAIQSNGNRAIGSHEEGWFVGHYRMGAPLCFWRDLAGICRQYM